MRSCLSDFGRDWQGLTDHIADWSVDLLRRAASELGHGLDHDAQRDIEGARDWRDLTSIRGFPNE